MSSSRFWSASTFGGLLLAATTALAASGAGNAKLVLKGEAAGDEGFYTLLDRGREIMAVHVVCGSAGARLDFWDEASGTPYPPAQPIRVANGFPFQSGLFFARDFCTCDEARTPNDVAARKLLGKLRRHYFPQAAPVDPF